MRKRQSSSKLKTIFKSDLMTKPQNWDGFFKAADQLGNFDDFLSEDERKQPAQDRDPLEDFDKP